jgi:hypothetical protein
MSAKHFTVTFSKIILIWISEKQMKWTELKITVLLYITPHALVDRHTCFRGTCCLHLQSRGVSHAKKYGSDIGKGGYSGHS